MWHLVRSRNLFLRNHGFIYWEFKNVHFLFWRETKFWDFVCFFKILMYFCREGKRIFSELHFIRLSNKQGQYMGNIPYSTRLYVQDAPRCPWSQCWPLLVAPVGFLKWVPDIALPLGLGKALRHDWGVLPSRHEMLNAAKHNSGWGRRKHMGCKAPIL